MPVKEVEVSTEKEQFFNCAFLAALANGKSVIHSVRQTPEILAFADYLGEIGSEVSIIELPKTGSENREFDWEITGTNFNYKKPLDLNWLGNELPYQQRNQKIVAQLLNGSSLCFEEKIAVRDSLIRELATFGAQVKWVQDGTDEPDELTRRLARVQKIKNERKWIFDMQPSRSLLAKERYIAGDVSQAAAVILATTLTPNSEIKIKNVNLDQSRAGIFGAFKRLGAEIEITSRHERGNDIWGDISVKSAKSLVGKRFNPDVLATCLDEIPLLAVMASFAEDETVLHIPTYALNYCKPVLSCLFTNLKLAGIDCGLFEEGLILRGRDEIIPADFDSAGFPILELALEVLATSKNFVRNS
ncbi:3-phosphoshikimate 1-carboxyvinyltransferase [Fibrobacterales bacterium]|nr:3-phosphoshikimate 1-carboxyvinyltransferase [Fibrobacterales bacterium]